jgi:teichuronic acid biosynthesis glycosyltransferase TuaC
MKINNTNSGILKVLFVCAGKNEPEISPIITAQGQSLRKCGVDVRYFPIGGKGLRTYLKSMHRLRKHLRQNSFALVHAHYGLSAIVAFSACGKTPLVVSFMGDDLLGSNKSNGKVTGLSRCFSRLNIFLARYFYDFIIVKSGEMLDKLCDNTRAKVIPNGVDLDVFHPIDRDDAINNSGFQQKRGNFLFVGDPSRPEKNYNLALESVRRAGNNLDLHVLRNKKPSELCSYYNAADAVVITSYHEGSPNIVKEAMACNCPLVSTEIGDVRMLSEGVTGHFLSPFDPVAMADKLLSALKFRSVKGGTTGRHRIIELKLDSTSVAEQIVSIYKELLVR